jgi:hypothetical protein
MSKCVDYDKGCLRNRKNCGKKIQGRKNDVLRKVEGVGNDKESLFIPLDSQQVKIVGFQQRKSPKNKLLQVTKQTKMEKMNGVQR